jgi:hypothetical protein
MFVGSKAPWYAITDELPQFEEYPPQFGMTATPRSPVPTSGGHTRGSCLCGAVAYEITGTPQRFFYCHCSRCRLGRSAAHASNVFFKADDFHWVRGGEQVRDYKLPGAQFFGTAFCSRCGSAMPRISLERGIVNVPAGSLDTDPGMEPAAHIFVASRASWERITDKIPQFDEMPPRK